jgi:hypothetical protein
MRVLVTLTIALALSSTSCSPSASPAATNSNVSIPAEQANVNANGATPEITVPEGKLFAILPDGPVRRIEAEGYGDEQIIQNLKSIDKTITYKHLEKDPQRYSGQAYSAEGTVVQIFEKGDQTTALIGADRYGARNFWVIANFATKFLTEATAMNLWLAGTSPSRVLSHERSSARQSQRGSSQLRRSHDRCISQVFKLWR